MVQHVIEPPMPIARFFYRCEKMFDWNQLLCLYEIHDAFGLAVIGGEKMEFYKIRGTNRTLLSRHSIHRINKKKVGGSSANRYMRTRENQIDAFVSNIVECFNESYMNYSIGKPNVIGIVIAGAAELKDTVTNDNSLHPMLKACILQVLTVSDVNSLHDIVQRAMPYFMGADIQQENNCIVRLLDRLQNSFHGDNDEKSASLFVYGKEAIEQAINECALKELYVHRSVVLTNNATNSSSSDNNKQWMKVELFDVCKANGCDIVEFKSFTESMEQFISNFGGVIGIRFFTA
jgi:peptide subunit release factor 1 (eRF1)